MVEIGILLHSVSDSIVLSEPADQSRPEDIFDEFFSGHFRE